MALTNASIAYGINKHNIATNNIKIPIKDKDRFLGIDRTFFACSRIIVTNYSAHKKCERVIT